MREDPDDKDLFRGFPKEIILNDGTGVTVRTLGPGDEDALYDMFNRFGRDDIWFLNHDMSERQCISSWIKHLDPKRVISLVAVLEKRIIANAALMRKQYGAKSHVGKIRIAVDPFFREKKLATWMLLELVNLGIDMGLKSLVMSLAGQRDISVIRAVKKLGFTKQAVLKGYLLDYHGIAQDLVLLMKDLRQGWLHAE